MPRRSILILTLLVLSVSPASASAANFLVTVNRQAETGGFVSAQSDAHGAIRLLVERAGAPVLDAKSPFAYAARRLETQAGDVVKVFQPDTAAAPSATVTLDDRPTIDHVCAGAPGFTGRLTNSASSFVAGAQTYNPFGTRSGDANYGRSLKTAPDAYAVQLTRPARLGEFAVVVQRLLGSGVTLSTSVSRPVVDCSNLAPAPTDGLVSFRKRDIRPLANGVQVKLTCSPLSTIACIGSGMLSLNSKRVGTKAFTIAAGKSQRLTVRLSKRALRTLRKRRRIKVKLTVATKNQAGALLSQSARVTLRAKRRRR